MKYIFSIIILLITYGSIACTRIMYTGSHGVVVTGRTMDWTDDVTPNIYVFPRGINRDGEAGDNSMEWTSKYGSVITSGYNTFTTDGLNEKGLMFNLLYLRETSYKRENDNRQSISVGAWGQYVLDNFATVSEAVNELAKDNMRVNDPTNSSLHFSLSDATGNSAIIEYIGGEIKIYEGSQYRVLTNSPTYDIQIEKHKSRLDSITFLPGGISSADRFARASFYTNELPKTDKAIDGVMSVFAVLRTISTPIHVTSKDDKDPEYTVWRTVADQKNLIYYFEMVDSPTFCWLDLSQLSFKKGTSIKKLILDNGSTYMGNVTDKLIQSIPFKFVQ